MNGQAILNSTITIEEVQDKGKKLSLKGNDGARTYTYSLWKTKQDGSDSQAFTQYKTMGLGTGQAVMIGYVIDEYETEINGFPKRVQSKKIINFRETTQTPQTEKSLNLGHPVASQGHRNYDQEGYEKCAWTYFIEVCNGDLGTFAEALQQGVIHDAFQAIKADSKKHFSPLRQAVRKHASQVVEDLPVIQQDEIDVEGIPF
jgi:hypothetical protein